MSTTSVEPIHLTGTRVVLRDFTAADLDAVASIVGDERVTESLSFDARSRAQAEAMLAGVIERSHVDPRSEYYFAVTIADVVVGFVRLGLGGVRAAKLGVATAADRWREGIAHDACCTMLDFAFSVLELHRVTAAIGPRNTASQALVNGLGFTHEGQLRDHVYTNGAWRDSLLYSVLADEWTARELGSPVALSVPFS